jgi:hypothetical protein
MENKTLNGKVKIFPSIDSLPTIPPKPCVLENFFDFWSTYNHIKTGTVLIRQSLVKQGALFKAGLRMAEDLEYWAYLATFGKWGFIPDIYWVSDSAAITTRNGWLNKYRKRRKLSPTMEEWQERILPRLTHDDWQGYKHFRGYVAANVARNLFLGGQITESRKTIINYGAEMPPTWSSQLLKLGDRYSDFTWRLAGNLIHLREHHKNIFYYLLSFRNRFFKK